MGRSIIQDAHFPQTLHRPQVSLMKKLIAATLALSLTVPYAAREDSETYDVGSKVNADITLTDIDGKKHRFGDYKDKLVVVDFWSINCPWSIKAEPKLLALHEEYREKGVVFLAINSNKTEHDWDAENPFEEIEKYVRKNEITYPILIDKNNVVADQFGGLTTPHLYVINKGVIAYNGGLDDNPGGEPENEYLRTALDEILAGKAVTTAKTKPKGCSIKRVAKRPTE